MKSAMKLSGVGVEPILINAAVCQSWGMALSTLRDLLHRLSFSSDPGAVSVPARHGSVHVGHSEAMVFTADSVGVGARKLKWYFAHASVGSNLLSGLKDLNIGHPIRFPYRSESSKGTPVADAQPATIYEHNRGNPGWKAKMDQFSAAVQNGWRFPNVDVVMNKLCYIDQFASAKYYIKSMSKLEASYPETIFVYTTMPLTTAADWASRLRDTFNREVRDWTQSNKQPLFDIADIEAHDEKGNPCTFASGGKTFARMCEEYTDDGGHLNALGRRVMARGFYAMAVALAAGESSAAGPARAVPAGA
jgi:hypothetical protein